MNLKKLLTFLKVILSLIFLLVILVVFFQAIEIFLDKKITIPFAKDILFIIGQLWKYNPLLFFFVFGITTFVLYISGVFPLFIISVFTIYNYLIFIINHLKKKLKL